MHFFYSAGHRPSWRKAFVETLVVTLLCVALVGLVFLPSEVRRFQSNQYRKVIACETVYGQNAFLALVESMDKQQRTTNIQWKECLAEVDSGEVLCPQLKPECMAVNASGTRLFIGDASGSLYTTALKPDDMILGWIGRVTHGWALSMACSPDESTLVVLAQGVLYAWEFDSVHYRNGRLRWCHVDSGIRAYAISSDSKSVLYCRATEQGAELISIELSTGMLGAVVGEMKWVPQRLSMSSDGAFLVGVGDRGDVILLERNVEDELWKLCAVPGLCTGKTLVANFLPKGSILMTTEPSCRRLIAWDLKARKELGEYDDPSQVEDRSRTILGCIGLDGSQFLSWDLEGNLCLGSYSGEALLRERTLVR